MTSPNAPIEGEVAAVLSSREVLLNRGESDGVEIGTRCVILDAGTTVKLPGTDREVGVRMPKTVVKVVRFEGLYASVGRTCRTIKSVPQA
ncbi:hypothetical protein HNP40_001814 [Mycobacteroides chelonae]|nr:hypothetical protein [Mycobacteroides chelonae]